MDVTRIPTIFLYVFINGNLILHFDSVHKLGIIVDSNLSSGQHMNAIYKSANYHLSRIAYIRKYCSKRITRKLINALVLFRIDNSGSLFSDINNTNKVDRFYALLYDVYIMLITATICLHICINIMLSGFHLERYASTVYYVYHNNTLLIGNP